MQFALIDSQFEWLPITTKGSIPPARTQAAATYLPSKRCLVLSCGSYEDMDFNDFYTFKLGTHL